MLFSTQSNITEQLNVSKSLLAFQRGLMVNCCLHFRNPENNQAACQALYCLIADVYKNSETS